MHHLNRYLESLQPRNTAYPLIAIDGPGGAGKSTLAQSLQHVLGDYALLHGDDYFEPGVHSDNPALPGRLNSERFMQDVGHDMQAGRSMLRHRPYDWHLGRLVTHTLTVNGGVIHEGIKSLALPIDWDVAIWVEAPRNERYRRCVEQRTDAQRKATGASPRELSDRFNAWADEADVYRTAIEPEAKATCIVDGQAPFQQQLTAIEQALDATRN